jgi:hypothetical protein
MGKKTELFANIGEPYAAGLFGEEGRSAFARYSRATRRYWEACALPRMTVGLCIRAARRQTIRSRCCRVIPIPGRAQQPFIMGRCCRAAPGMV